jgi:NAD-dependent SIR2 family protein deacetylase
LRLTTLDQTVIATNLEHTLELAAEAIDDADALLITAGAGMGVDSGLPDFRGPEGFWAAYPAIAKLGLSFSQMANPAWFDKDPALAWAFYGHRLNLYRRTIPHIGFHLLLKAVAQKSGGYFIFTSNVDGQFQKAGFAPDRIVECHGSIHHLQCCQNCAVEIWDAAQTEVIEDETIFRATGKLPECKYCAALARPNILMFGDFEWQSLRSNAQEANFSAWTRSLSTSMTRLVVVEIGAGTAIPTVRYTSERVAASASGTLIRINPREPEVPAGHLSLPLNAAEGLQRIFQKTRQTGKPVNASIQ